MTERLRIAALWVVVAVLAVLALLAPRSASAPATAPAPAVRRIVPTVVPAAVADDPDELAPDGTAAALDALASGATCDDRLAAVAHLRAAGDPAAIPALTATARGDRCVAAAARDAIRALGRATDDARW